MKFSSEERAWLGGSDLDPVFSWFADPGRSAWANWIVSAFSLAVAGLALWLTWRERRERLQESRRAKLKGYIAHPDGNRWYLVLHNYGGAEAKNVVAWINDVQLSNHPLIARNKKLELSAPIGPYTDVRYLLTRSLNVAENLVLKLNWQDDSGKRGEYRSKLTF